MEQLTFAYFVQWAFYGLIVYFAYDLKDTAKELRDTIKTMGSSVESLNLKVAVVIEQTEGHKELLDRHDERIYNLERDKK